MSREHRMQAHVNRMSPKAAEHFFNTLPHTKCLQLYDITDFPDCSIGGRNLLLYETVARLAQLLEGCPDAYKDVKVYTIIKGYNDRPGHYDITYVCADGKLWSLSLYVGDEDDLSLGKGEMDPEYAASYYKRFKVWEDQMPSSECGVGSFFYYMN